MFLYGMYGIASLSQELETGCPKLAIVTFWGVLFFKGDRGRQYTQIKTKIMYLLIEIRHTILLQCDGNYIDY